MEQTPMQVKQLSVKEGDKIIAQFMGKHPDVDLVIYHSSWDCLIGACKKFDLLYETAGVDLGLDYNFHCDDIDDAVTTYDIGAAFKALVSAICWYNNLSQQ